MTTLFSRLLPALLMLALPVMAAAIEAQSGSTGSNRPSSGNSGTRNALPAPQAGVAPAPREWWKPGADFNARLHLSSEQSTRIQQIFEAGMTQLRSQSQELDRLLERLSKLIQKEETIDLISQQIDRVEATRGAANKTRTLMLLEMRRVLNPQQRTTFEMLSDQWMRDRERAQQGQPNQPRSNDNRRPDPTPDRGRPGF